MTEVAARRPALVRALAALVLLLGASVAFALVELHHTDPPRPALDGRLEADTLMHQGRTRSWIAYLPAGAAPHPALLIALHGSMGSGQQVRAETFGYDFDRLADRDGFVVVYPQGYEGYWNSGRVRDPSPATRADVDDLGFLQALVARMVQAHGVDPTRVFVTGVSNGGSMVLRLALQAPAFARAYAVVSASVPTPDNLAFAPQGLPVSILFMNGTEDPINPWDGGDVVLWPVLSSRGPVRSVQASVDYFRRLAGLDAAPVVTAIPDLDPDDGCTVTRSLWSGPGRRSVALYAIVGGGHVAPHPARYGWRLLGHTDRDIHAADEIWTFFHAAP